MTTMTKKKLYCATTCHTWTDHSVLFCAQTVTCLSCGHERRTNLSELSTEKPEVIAMNQGGPERHI